MFQAFLKVTVWITTTLTNKLQLAYEKCEMNIKYSFPLHTTVRIYLNTLWTGDADLRLYITTVQDGWCKSAFLTRALFPRTIHLIMQWSCWRMFIETWPHSELMVCDKYRVSQEERTKLREIVPYVKLYRYNPKHLYPKLNGYGDNGQRKVWTSCISA